MNAWQLLLIFLCIQSNLALKCMTCGTDGICQPGIDEVSKECEDTSKSCMISLIKVGNKTYDNKDCFQGPNGLNEAMRGCVHFSNSHGLDDEACFCDQDECNKHRCDDKYCDCPFSNPDECIDVPDGPKLQCRVCAGENCQDPQLVECQRGDTSCSYQKTKVNGVIVAEERNCFFEPHGFTMQGCVDVQGSANGETFDGEVCYCHTNDCNSQSCDPTQCSCIYADPDSCNSEGTTTKRTTITTTNGSNKPKRPKHSSVILLTLLPFLLSWQ